MFGRTFNGFKDFKEVAPFGDTKVAVKEREKFWQHFQSVVLPAITERNAEYQQRSRDRLDRSRTVVSEQLAMGTQVMALDHTRTGKWNPKTEGPYTVAAVSKGGAYTLQGPDGELLSRRRVRDTLQVYRPLVPTGGEGEKTGKPASDHKRPRKGATKGAVVAPIAPQQARDHYDVEKVVAHEWNPELKTNRFYVKWEGYPDSDNSWVKQADFDDLAPLKKYWKETNARITADNQKPLSKLTSGKRITSRKKLIKPKL
jgi:hypothetical protein